MSKTRHLDDENERFQKFRRKVDPKRTDESKRKALELEKRRKDKEAKKYGK